MALTAGTILIPLRQPDRASDLGASHALLVQLRGSHQPPSSSFPVDVCVLIDCGWFMHNDQVPNDSRGSPAQHSTKLDAVKRAVGSLLSTLPESHTISLVAYGESAIPCATRMIRGQEDAFGKAVGSLVGRASSHLTIGLREAARVLLSGSPQSHKRILLLQGGQVKGTKAAVLETEELASQQISVDVIAVGTDASRLLSQHLASAGNGRSWLAVTSDQVTNAVREALAATTDMLAHGISVEVSASDGWSISGCVRSGAEYLPLYAPASAPCCDATVFVSGVRQSEPMDLWFYMRPPEDHSGSMNLRGTVAVTEKGDRSVVRGELDYAGEAETQSIMDKDLESLVGNCRSAELKLPERWAYLAYQQEDRAALARHLKALQALLAEQGNGSVRPVVEQIMHSVGHNSALLTEVLNLLASGTSGAPYGMVSLPPERTLTPQGVSTGIGTQVASREATLAPAEVPGIARDAKEAARTDEAVTNFPASDREERAVITAMVDSCSETLITHDMLEVALAAMYSAQVDANGAAMSMWERVLTSPAAERQSRALAAEEVTRVFTQSMCEAMEVWSRLRRLTERDDSLGAVAASAVKCAEFYGWKDAGWMSSVEALRERGAMLRRLLEEQP